MRDVRSTTLIRLRWALVAIWIGVLVLAGTASASLRVTVRPGDTLSGIAARQGVSVRSLMGANRLGSPHLIIAGTTLRVPDSGGAVAAGVGGRYTVRPGDTLSGIAARFGTTTSALARRNGIGNAQLIVVGRRLVIGGSARAHATASSGGGRYTVRPGENLGAIGARFGTSAAALARMNGIADPNMIVAGTRLRVPAGGVTMSQGPLTPITAASAGWGNHPSRSAIAELIARHAASSGVDPALVRAVGWQESGWWQGARSSTGAIGVMQLMPGTAEWIGDALLGRHVDPYDASDNIAAGAAYLAYLQRRTGSRRLAIASYYQGLRSVTSRGLYGETEAYVSSVSAFIGRV